jgi:ribonuclease P protein component
LGLVVAKKNSKRAVQRNRIKRIARESFRHQQHQLGGLDTVVLARQGLDQLDNNAMHSMFNQLWQQLQQRAEKRAKQQSLTNS